MGLLILLGAVAASTGLVVALRSSSRRGTGLVLVVGGSVLAVAALAIVVVRDLERRDLPPPAFPALADRPNRSLHGTVAYIVEVKDPTASEATSTRRRACARLAAASGAATKDAFCWSITDEALATTVWQDDGRLLVTSFRAPVGEHRMIAEWGKLVDVATGRTEDVAADRLGRNARPPAGPATDPDGNRLVKEGADGTLHIQLQGPSGRRTLLKIDDANPEWSIQSGPMWSPDFNWILMWDGSRLLLTTVDDPTTRVLTPEASGGVFNYDVATFDIIGDDVLGP